MKLFYVISFVLFITLQYSFLLSDNSIFSYTNVKNTLHLQNKEILKLTSKNQLLETEIQQLVTDKKSMEIYAREIFGYIKKNEFFVQVIKDEK